MKRQKTIVLAVLAIFFYCINANAQDIETKFTQSFIVKRTGWNKVFYTGNPVTIYSFKQKDGIYSFGIYSDDYAGDINMKNIPFDVDLKQLKKLPKNSKKKEASYTEMACAKARKKALSGMYKTTATSTIMSRNTDAWISQGDQMMVLGYSTERSYVGTYTYYYAVVGKDGAGIAYSYDMDKVTVNNVPLPFLPSIGDPEVKAVIAKANQRIKDLKKAELDAYYEKKRKEAEDRAAQKKALEEERMANLKLMDPAYIEVKGWNMDSAGGIAVNLTFTNCDRFHSIKYIYFQGYFLNAVGDKCRNSVSGSTVWKYTGVGPINPFPSKPGQYGKSYIANYCFDDPLFYAKTAHKFRLSSVTIEYTNGKKKTLTGDELDIRVDYED
jgi:hypothetical protein